MKDLEAERRTVLRDFMIKANVAIGDSWSKLRSLCGPACDSAHAVDSSRGAVDREVASLAAAGVAEKASVFLSGVPPPKWRDALGRAERTARWSTQFCL